MTFWERFGRATVRGIVGGLVMVTLLHGCHKRRMCETYCGARP